MIVKKILDDIELVAARLRVWLAGTLTLMVGLQTAYAAGAFDKIVPAESTLAKWLPVAAILVARYTQGKTTATALIEAKTQQPETKAGP